VHRVGTTISCRFIAPVLALVVVGFTPGRLVGEQAPSTAPTAFPSAIAWTVELGAQPLAPPVVAGGRAFLSLDPGVLSARSLVDGAELWTTRVAVAGTPAASSTIVAVPTGDAIHAIRAASGHTAWVVRTEPLTAPPLMVGGWLFFATTGRLTALRVTDGAPVWTREFPVVEQRPAAEGTTLYVPTVEGRLYALDVATGVTKWEATVGPRPSEPLALADRVYVGTGRVLVCLKADSGKEDWPASIGASIRGAPAADAQHVYVVSMDNLLRALHRTNGAVQWKADLRYRPLAGPVVIGPTVTVGGVTTELRAFSAATGSVAGTLVLPSSAPMQPAFVLSEGGAGMIVTVTGSPDGKWSLTAAAPPLPSIGAAPLTVLPGTVVPLPGT
jgi:outer membrane protein assembly factor BamB